MSQEMESLAKIVKTLEEWPESWSGNENDIPIGSLLLLEFKHYLSNLIEKGRSARTVKNHANYIWALGGEIIREINMNEINLDALLGKDILLEFINNEGGLYWRHAYDQKDHDRYDSVCRNLYRFIKNHS